jgi:hypothetical protein
MEIHEGGDNAGCGAGGPLLSVSIDEMLAAWKGDAWKGDVLKDNAREVLP